MSRKYGVSVVSLLPWSMGPLGLPISVGLGRNAGFDGLQVLPLRGWTSKGYYDQFEGWIISYEDAWEFNPLLRLSVTMAGTALVSRVVFGEQFSPGFRNAIRSSHCFVSETYGFQVAVEAHPELAQDIYEYYEYCAEGSGHLVWDTLHVRRRKRDGGEGIDWRRLLNLLQPRDIALIHLHLRWNEVRSFLKGEGEVIDMLIALKEKEVVAPVIVEVFPAPDQVNRLKRILKVAKSLLD